MPLGEGEGASGEGEALRVLTPPKEGEALAEAQAEPTPTVPEGLLLGSRLLGVEEGQGVAVALTLGHRVALAEREAEVVVLLVRLPVPLREGVPLPHTVEVPLGEAHAEGKGEPLLDALAQAQAEGERVPARTLPVGECEVEGLRVGAAEGELL